MGKIPKSLKYIWKQLVLILLAFLSFSYAMFQGGFVSWFLFYSFLPFAIYGLLLSFYRFNHLQIKREFERKELQAGDKVVVTMKIERKSFFPLFYMVVEDEISSIYWQIDNPKTICFPFFRRKFEFTYELNHIPRGEHIFHGVHVKIGDLLGLIEKEKKFLTLEDKVIVYPTYEEIVYVPMVNNYEERLSVYHNRLQKDTTMVVGIRQYQPGDRLSWINWKATAKKNEMMTKEFEQGKSYDCLIIMDCVNDPRFETMVSFVASLARAIHRKGIPTGFFALSKERILLPIRYGEDQERKLFFHLAKVQDNSPMSLEQVIDTEEFLHTPSSTLFIVTGQLSMGLIEKGTLLSTRNRLLTIFLVKRKKEMLSEEENRLKTKALSRGMNVIVVREGSFQEAFSGVRQ